MYASDFVYASDLVAAVRDAHPDASIGVAAHPEGHPRSSSIESDRLWLAHKLEQADFGVTQFFFEVGHYWRMVEEVAAHGVETPIIPGVMPITNAGQVQRFAAMAGAAFPSWLAERVSVAADNDEVRDIGVDVATSLCEELLDGGAPGPHFYTLNRSTATRGIYANLGLPVSASSKLP